MPLTQAEKRMMRMLSTEWKLGLGDFFSAVVTLVVAPGAARLPSILHSRHGRTVPPAARVLGPLWEQVFTCPPRDMDLPLRQWVQSFAAELEATPPLLGRAVADVWGDALARDRSLVVANVIPAAPSYGFGAGAGRPVDMELPLNGAFDEERCALGFALLRQRGGPWQLLLQYDRDMYPAPGRLMSAVRKVILQCANHPEAPARNVLASLGHR
jgi:hypothetical protein